MSIYNPTMNDLKKELWRLRINWLFTLLTSPLYSISMTGISSSFHQFVTNPTAESLHSYAGNGTQMAPGLGESELFYSLLISGLNFGSMIGGISSGFLLQLIPYWYLWLFTILTHIVGYIIYSVGNAGWLIMISRVLAGYYLGAMLTLGFSYASKTSEMYVKVQRELGKKTNQKSAIRIRNNLFALISLGFSSGFVWGPGMAVILAQFQSVNQFRSIAWFNVACGVTLLALFFVMFRGESSCNKPIQCSQMCTCREYESMSTLPGPLQIFIVFTMFLLSLVEMFRFGILQTLFNPITSDSFGLNERDASYVMFALGFPQVLGSILLIVLQRIKISTQAIVFVGILMTVIGYALLGDWQAIPYDRCTEYSPFHHPEIVHNESIEAIAPPIFSDPDELELVATTQEQEPMPVLRNFRFLSNVQLNLAGGATVNSQYYLGINFTCEQVEDCQCSQNLSSVKSSQKSLCLNYTLNSNGDMTLGSVHYKKEGQHELFICNPSSQNSSPARVCVSISKSQQYPVESNVYDEIAQIESLQVLSDNSYSTAKENCMNADVPNHQCHWIPSSLIAKKECGDCQPICRSLDQTLTFTQFCLGLTMLLLSNPLLWTSIVALVFNQVPKDIQGIVMGCLTTMNSVSRTVTPLLLDAGYEGMQKRTFLLMFIMTLLHIPFLIEIVVLFKKLGPCSFTKNEESSTDQTAREYLEPLK